MIKTFEQSYSTPDKYSVIQLY